jgi:hypothetical protein
MQFIPETYCEGGSEPAEMTKMRHGMRLEDAPTLFPAERVFSMAL